MISTILLTNTDADHIGSLGLFKNAVLYMNLEEVQIKDGKKGKTRNFKPRWKYGPCTTLNNNDTIIIDGLKIKTILTPGHPATSSCYIIGLNYLVSGDNLVVKNGKYERFNLNSRQQTKAFKSILNPKSYKYILTGHNGIVKNENKTTETQEEDENTENQTSADL